LSVRVLAIPVKSLGRAKERLSAVLSPLERGALTLAMFEDVLDVALATTGWQPWVVSGDEVVLELAAGRGAVPVPEGDEPGLLGALARVEEEASGRGADALAILLADLPLLDREALATALHTLGPVVLAPSADGAGTNLLLRRPLDSIPARFGSGSLQAHMDEASDRRLPVSKVEVPEIAFDLDAPADILTLLETGRRGRTRDVCEQLGLETRVRVGA
jgi:2-phospho-L-lactate/phosphoenolpyruvate guanylyltransferase